MPCTSIVRVVNMVLGAGSFGQRVGGAAVTAGGGVTGVSRMQADAAGSVVAGASSDAAEFTACGDVLGAALGSIQTSVVLTGSAGARLQLAAKTEKPIALATRARNTGRF